MNEFFPAEPLYWSLIVSLVMVTLLHLSVKVLWLQSTVTKQELRYFKHEKFFHEAFC